MQKARDVFFHEDAIAPATPMLYSDNDAPQEISESADKTKTTVAIQPSTMKPRFMIQTPPRHARMPIIREVSPEEDESIIHDDRHGT